MLVPFCSVSTMMSQRPLPPAPPFPSLVTFYLRQFALVVHMLLGLRSPQR